MSVVITDLSGVTKAELSGRLDTANVNQVETAFIAGIVPNTPGWLTRWLDNPPAIAPATMMPSVGLDEREVVDVAAYLMTLGQD